jgi:Mrp family chromosome partitioning ATPase
MILESIGRSYDVVIVDAPPVVGLSDAPILSRLTEATLLVVSTGQVTRKSAAAALKRLKAAGANVIGVALSKFTVGRFDYGYAYKYMNYQYYGYGNDAQAIEDKSVAATGTGKSNGATKSRGLVQRWRGRVADYLDRLRSAA